jgi:hypothetical protein
MSTLGKILIVVQVIMSLLFMCAAGAVYTVQRNWKDQYDNAQKQISSQRDDYDFQIEELNKQIDELGLEVTAQTNRADQVVGENTQLKAQVQDLTRRNDSLEGQVAIADGIAEASANEAELRQAEAEQQRVVNQTLRATLDEQVQENVQLKDANYTLQVANDNLNEQYLALLEQVAFLEKVVAAEGLSTDPREVADLTAPPPPVDGLVLNTRKDRTNRTEFAHVSIGSDDGLQVGHELDVYRSAVQNGGDPQYLGRIRIVHLLPDEAVGMVVEAAKNGIIEKGDNVTTKL